MYNTIERSHFTPREVAPVVMTGDAQIQAVCQAYDHLCNYGINLQASHIDAMMRQVNSMHEAMGQDSALQAPTTTGSIASPVQFLQAWLPGFVEIITAVRRIDDLIGITNQGDWEDEQVVQGVQEVMGTATLYTDYGNTNQSDWNLEFERRNIVRYEMGITVGSLEQARAAKVRVDAAQSKRGGAARELEILRNSVGFNGFNGGANRTYGFLNDPNLPAYVTVANGAGGTPQWSTKDFQEIKNDLLVGFQTLRTQSSERVDPKADMITLAVATNAVDYLEQVTDFSVSVGDWLKKAYPKCRVTSAPELNTANGGVGVFYMYAESVQDSGSDDSRTWVQVVPTKFKTLGVNQQEKSYSEAYSNATSGAFLKRAYAVYRASGIS